MEISGLGASKLLEALEKLNVSKGAELRSPAGPQGNPSAELVRAFEEALNRPPETEAVQQATSTQTVFSGAGASDASVSDAMPGARIEGGVDASVMRAETVLEVGTPPEVIPGTAGVEEQGLSANRTERGLEPVSDSGMERGERLVLDDVEQDAPSLSRAESRTDRSDTGTERIAPDSAEENLQELARLMEKIGSGNPSAADLYRLQYLVGILKVQASSGSQLSLQVNQGFESLLKQQG